MYVYRVVDEYKYMKGHVLNDGEYGVNSFQYEEGKDYVHFFILPESAQIYQEKREKETGLITLILKCDIPYSLLKDNFGIGMYEWYSAMPDPVLEVRINKDDFDHEMVSGIAHEMQEHWKDKKVYNRYLDNVIDCVKYPVYFDPGKDIIEQLEGKPVLDPRFNFLNYFPDDQLKKEGLRNGYCHYDDVKIESVNKSFLDKIKSLFSKKNSR